jgi:hypothetical protein
MEPHMRALIAIVILLPALLGAQSQTSQLAVNTVSVAPVPGAACTASDPAVRQRARHYAPILEFAPYERYFPTIPYFAAFDSAINHIAYPPPPTENEKRANKMDWHELDRDYQRTIDRRTHIPTRSAVFYHQQWLTPPQIARLWTSLRRDNQAQRRLGLSTPPRKVEVFKYVFYYVNDFGLRGHGHDIEKVFVFVPHSDSTNLDNPGDTLPVIVVGAGHTKTTPNNVSVLSGPQMVSNLRKRNGRIGVLVELGGHASAPDVGADGSFDIGVDVNWFLDYYWGTRDVMSIAGNGFLGKYQAWMTMRRDPSLSVTLADSLPWHAVAALGGDPVVQALDKRAAEAGVDSSSVKRGRYAMIPMAYFTAFDQSVLGYAVATEDSVRKRHMADAQRALDTCIDPLLDEVWDTRRADSALTRDAMLAFAKWHADGSADWDYDGVTSGRKGVPLPWKDDEFEDPEVHALLKSNLQRPTSWMFIDRLTLNVTNSVSPTVGLRLGVQFGISDEHYIHLPGVFELQAGVYLRQDEKWQQAVALVYDNAYHAPMAWFVKFEYVDERARIEQSPGMHAFAASGGVSITSGRLGIRAGPRIGFGRRGHPSADEMRWELNMAWRRRR